MARDLLTWTKLERRNCLTLPAGLFQRENQQVEKKLVSAQHAPELSIPEICHLPSGMISRLIIDMHL